MRHHDEPVPALSGLEDHLPVMVHALTDLATNCRPFGPFWLRPKPCGDTNCLRNEIPAFPRTAATVSAAAFAAFFDLRVLPQPTSRKLT